MKSVDLTSPNFTSCTIFTGDKEKGTVSVFFIEQHSKTRFNVVELHNHPGQDKGGLAVFKSAKNLGSGVSEDYKMIYPGKLVLGEKFLIECRKGKGVDIGEGRIASKLITNPIIAIFHSGTLTADENLSDEEITIF